MFLYSSPKPCCSCSGSQGARASNHADAQSSSRWPTCLPGCPLLRASELDGWVVAALLGVIPARLGSHARRLPPASWRIVALAMRKRRGLSATLSGPSRDRFSSRGEQRSPSTKRTRLARRHLAKDRRTSRGHFRFDRLYFSSSTSSFSTHRCRSQPVLRRTGRSVSSS